MGRETPVPIKPDPPSPPSAERAERAAPEGASPGVKALQGQYRQNRAKGKPEIDFIVIVRQVWKEVQADIVGYPLNGETLSAIQFKVMEKLRELYYDTTYRRAIYMDIVYMTTYYILLKHFSTIEERRSAILKAKINVLRGFIVGRLNQKQKK